MKGKYRVWILAIVILAMLLIAPALAGVIYHGNVKSGVFHRPSCRYYNCKNCIAEFASREAAIAAGFRPCKICNP